MFSSFLPKPVSRSESSLHRPSSSSRLPVESVVPEGPWTVGVSLDVSKHNLHGTRRKLSHHFKMDLTATWRSADGMTTPVDEPSPLTNHTLWRTL